MNARGALWVTAVAVAGLGTWILWNAAPGVNWGMWSLAASVGGAACGRLSGSRPGARAGLCGLACGLAAGSAITADPVFHGVIFLGTLWLFAIAAHLAGDPRAERIKPSLALVAPMGAMAFGLAEAARRAGEVGGIVGTERHRPALRGSILALAVVSVFAAILAGADPILAAIRDGLVEILERLEFIPRLAFFLVLLTGAVGSYGMILRPADATVPSRGAASTPRWTDVERLIVLGAVALLFAAFEGLQLAYLFGNAPALAGSGVTFAEYARRGFAELTVVASLCTLLILGFERGARRGTRERTVRGLALVLIVLLWVLLVSAFRRLWLYEEAYGFTTARLYAQVYMAVVAFTLLMLAIDLARGLDAGRLLRRTAAAGAISVIALSLWNHEGWIARQNIERAARGGSLDVRYLVWDLSVNAVPAIVGALDRTPFRDALADALRERYRQRAKLVACPWFEWNLRQRQAADALRAAGIALGPALSPPAPSACVRIVPLSRD
jgi:uncharacterized protein DUF4153